MMTRHGFASDRMTRLDTGGPCETCGKWVPGERRFCGQCLIKRSKS